MKRNIRVESCRVSANWHPFEKSLTRHLSILIGHPSSQITPQIEPFRRITIKLHIQRRPNRDKIRRFCTRTAESFTHI